MIVRRRTSSWPKFLWWVGVGAGLFLMHVAAVQQTFSFVSGILAAACLIWLTARQPWPVLLGLFIIGELFSTLPAGVFTLAVLGLVGTLRAGKFKQMEFSLKFFSGLALAIFVAFLILHGAEQTLLRLAPGTYPPSVWWSLPASRFLFSTLGTTIAVVAATGIWRELFPEPQAGVQTPKYARKYA